MCDPVRYTTWSRSSAALLDLAAKYRGLARETTSGPAAVSASVNGPDDDLGVMWSLWREGFAGNGIERAFTYLGISLGIFAKRRFWCARGQEATMLNARTFVILF